LLNILLFGGLTLGHAALVIALVNRIHVCVAAAGVLAIACSTIW